MTNQPEKNIDLESQKDELFSQSIKELFRIVDKQEQEAILARLKDLEEEHFKEKNCWIPCFNNASVALDQLWQIGRGVCLLNRVTKTSPSSTEKVRKRMESMRELANQVLPTLKNIGLLSLSDCVRHYTSAKDSVIDAFQAVNYLFANIYYSIADGTDLNMVNVIDFIGKISVTTHFDMKFSPKEFVTLAVDSGANVNMRTKIDSETPLSKCMKINLIYREATIEALLSQGADIFQCCYSNKSANNNFLVAVLHFTVFQMKEATSILKIYQRFYNEPCSFFTDLLPNGSTFIQNFLRCAVNERDTSGFNVYNLQSKDKLTYLIEEGADLSSGQWDEHPALIVACHAEDLGMSCMDVCGMGASVTERGWFCRSILHVVSDAVTVETLCNDYGADILVDAVDFFGRTPLMHAVIRSDCRCQRPSKLEYLTKGLRDLCNCANICVDYVKTLVNQGANWKFVDQDGVSVLHLASASHPCILKTLLNHCQVCPEDISNMLDKNGASPLHYATFANNLGCVKLLLDSGADLDITDKCGNKPLDIAKLFGFHQITKVIQTKSSPNHVTAKRSDILEVDSCLKTQIVDVYDEHTTSIAGPILYLNKSMTETVYDSILRSPFLGCKLLDEAQEIQAEVTSLVMKLSQKIESMKPDFAFDVQLRGSSAERTKVGLPDEFDFNLIMKKIDDPVNFHIARTADYPVIVVSLHYMKKLNLHENKSSFHRCFIVTLLKVLNDQHFWTDSMLKMGGLRMGKVGAVLTLFWNGATYKHLQISIDLVPSFPVHEHPFIPLEFPVPVDFSGCELYRTQDQHGKMATSYSDMEALLMKLLPNSAVEAYKLSKAIRSVFVSKVFTYHDEFEKYVLPVDGFTSYHLKNLLMWEFNHLTRKGTDVSSLTRGEWVEGIYMRWRDNLRMRAVCGEESFDLRY